MFYRNWCVDGNDGKGCDVGLKIDERGKLSRYETETRSRVARTLAEIGNTRF